MKVVFISDIHGKPDNLERIPKDYDKLIVLGDIFGSNEENNQIILDFLKNNDAIIVKGNCDNEYFFESEHLSYFSDYSFFIDKGLNISYTHGHLYNVNYNPLSCDALIYGHKHYPFITLKDKTTYICVGSISFPRNESKCSYLVYENGVFRIFDLDKNVIDEIKL